jgi:indolepyruvate ferredoxin oxidoreductase beta subunit
MIFNILIAGVGGQGTVLASKLIAAAAIKSGYDVRTTETIGMAQRGGSVVGHTRIGENIYSPLISTGNAHVLIAFEPAEALRQLPFLSKEGTLIVCDTPVKPVTGTLSGQIYEVNEVIEYIKLNVEKSIIVPGQPILERYAKMLNVALLGTAAESGLFPFGIEAIRETISEIPRYKNENIASFEMGRKLYNESVNISKR